MDTAIVRLPQFIQAIRDAGYRNTSSALAELVDNAFEAEATQVAITVEKSARTNDWPVQIQVEDDGTGMSPSVLKTALQFGGSTHFGLHRGIGRFGMGLPNSSVSQARRLEVFTWTTANTTWWSYLDVDEIQKGNLAIVPKPKRTKSIEKRLDARHGTIVRWSKCDRLSNQRTGTLVRKLHSDLGRIFRHWLWEGKEITVNQQPVSPSDPLFLRNGVGPQGAKQYGPSLEYDIHTNLQESGKVVVTFAELPVAKWATMSNDKKREEGISKQAGISILRAGREIDFGWYFMGAKRKENYDDWWRCEVDFEPILDSLFGVVHTKQGIRPSEQLLEILSPDMEAIAHRLHARVRRKFINLKESTSKASATRAATRDILFHPPPCMASRVGKHRSKSVELQGLKYLIDTTRTDFVDFYRADLVDSTVRLLLNENHPFFDRLYRALNMVRTCDSLFVKSSLELLLFSAARSELQFDDEKASKNIANFRTLWSDLLAAFLT